MDIDLDKQLLVDIDQKSIDDIDEEIVSNENENQNITDPGNDDYNCCDMGQNDTVGKIELNPLSSCQVMILIARMTFNYSTSCLMS